MLFLCLLPFFAPVHDGTVSTGELELAPAGSRLVLTVDADRMLQCAGLALPDGTHWSPQQVEGAAPRILEHLADHYQLERDGRPWPLEARAVAGVVGFDPLLGVERIGTLQAAFDLPGTTGDFRLTLRHRLFDEVEADHAHRLHLRQGAFGSGPYAVLAGEEVVLTVEDPTFGGALRRALRFAGSGFQGAFGQLGALLFLGLMLWRIDGARRMGLVALAFAAGHLPGFFASGLGLLEPARPAVRWAAALAVVYVALEALWARDRSLRWATTLLLGVVFGLRFGLLFQDAGPPLLARAGCAAAFLGGIEAALGLCLLVWIPLHLLLARALRPATILPLARS